MAEDEAADPPKHAGGRPTLYRDTMPEEGHKLCLLGATDAEMADFWGVHVDTVKEWKNVHPEFSVAIASGKLSADANVAERLYQRALGYSHPAVKIFMPADAAAPVYAPYTEHYPPDTNALSLWLRNRQPAKWRDKAGLELTGPNDGPVVLVTGVPRAGDPA